MIRWERSSALAVPDEAGIAPVFKALSQPANWSVPQFHFPQEQRAPVAGQVSSVEIGFHSALFQALKSEGLLKGIRLNTNTLHQFSARRLFLW